MVRNYLIVAFRNIVLQPGYSAINVIGLAIGMTCAVLIGTFIYSEYAYNDYHLDSDRIYRVLSVTTDDTGGDRITTGVVGGFTKAAKDAIPEVEYATRISRGWGMSIDRGDGTSIGHEVMILDADAFYVFRLKLIRGDLSSLDDPYAVFLNESSAKRLYKDEDPIGKQSSTEGRYMGGEYVVAGIIKDMARESSIQVDAVKGALRFYGIGERDNRGGTLGFWEDWEAGQGWRPMVSYLKLAEGQDPRVVESKIADLVVARHGADYAKTERFVLQPLNRIYLHSRADFGNVNIEYMSGFSDQGDIQFVTVFTLIAAAILMIACVNYVNLATARYARRAREVGLRKVLGAFRNQLILQFLGESVLLAVGAAAIAAIAVFLLLPTFGNFMERDLASAFGAVTIAKILIPAAVVIGIVGGMYPALYLASREAVQTLKGPLKGSRKSKVRYGLVLIQFGATAVLLAGTLTVYDQLTFIRGKNLGYNPSEIVIMGLFGADRRLNTSYNDIKAAFLSHPNVLSAAASHLIPGIRRETQSILAEGHGDRATNIRILAVDEDFIDTL
jgi:putative ABC transport system permease protein